MEKVIQFVRSSYREREFNLPERLSTDYRVVVVKSTYDGVKSVSQGSSGDLQGVREEKGLVYVTSSKLRAFITQGGVKFCDYILLQDYWKGGLESEHLLTLCLLKVDELSCTIILPTPVKIPYIDSEVDEVVSEKSIVRRVMSGSEISTYLKGSLVKPIFYGYKEIPKEFSSLKSRQVLDLNSSEEVQLLIESGTEWDGDEKTATSEFKENCLKSFVADGGTYISERGGVTRSKVKKYVREVEDPRVRLQFISKFLAFDYLKVKGILGVSGRDWEEVLGEFKRSGCISEDLTVTPVGSISSSLPHSFSTSVKISESIVETDLDIFQLILVESIFSVYRELKFKILLILDEIKGVIKKWKSLKQKGEDRLDPKLRKVLRLTNLSLESLAARGVTIKYGPNFNSEIFLGKYYGNESEGEDEESEEERREVTIAAPVKILKVKPFLSNISQVKKTSTYKVKVDYIGCSYDDDDDEDDKCSI
jgi:hypothetical protein